MFRVGFQEAMKILTGSTEHQYVDGYFCDNVVYPAIEVFYILYIIIIIIIMTITYELPRYAVWKMDTLLV